jgi:hypothetical protein
MREVAPVEDEIRPRWRSAEDYIPPLGRDAGDVLREEDVLGSTQLEYICEHIVYQAADWGITGENVLSLAFKDGKIL